MPRPPRQRDTLTPAKRSRPRDLPHAPTSAAAIEAQLSPQGEPVLGLYLHIAYHKVMSTFSRTVGHGQVTPAIIGVITTLAAHPGISQARLARLIGLERATIGSTVGRAIEAGFVVRADAHGDARSYALSLSPRGERMLRTLRRRIAEHERAAGAHLTPGERRALRALAGDGAVARELRHRSPGAARQSRRTVLGTEVERRTGALVARTAGSGGLAQVNGPRAGWSICSPCRASAAPPSPPRRGDGRGRASS